MRYRHTCLLLGLLSIVATGCGMFPGAYDGPMPVGAAAPGHRMPPAQARRLHGQPMLLGQMNQPQQRHGAPVTSFPTTTAAAGPVVPVSHLADSASLGEAEFTAARTLERQGQWPQAISAYERLIQQQPDHARAIHRLAVLHDRAGDATRSLDLYRAAARLNPRDPELLCDLGYSRYLQGDYALAERSLQLALQLNPSLTRAHNNLALVWARRGDDQRALAAFRQAGFSEEQAAANLRNARLASQRSYQSAEQSEAVRSIR